MRPGELARLACLLEATARKPGNVHRHVSFADSAYDDFINTGAAMAEAFDESLNQKAGVGQTVWNAVSRMRQAANTNTYLGTALLLAPLAAAHHHQPPHNDLRPALRRVLQSLDIDDARWAYRAIRLAAPGGLGQTPQHDVSTEPDITLLQAMSLAAERDSVARQYANSFADVFDRALPNLLKQLNTSATLEAAIVHTALTLLADLPDTLIERKCGLATARETSQRAADVLATGWPTGQRAARALADFDAWLRADGHRRNPGATADLIAATLYVALHDHRIAPEIDFLSQFADNQPGF